MNKELKIMIYTALGILVVLLISVNLATLISNDYITETTKSSQRIALNRLRRPHLNRSSELGKYPDLKKKRITLLAIRKSNRLIISESCILLTLKLISSQPVQKSMQREENIQSM